jgi:phosphinothricin acetyltransferase
MIREARQEDLPRLTALYNSYVEGSHATFDDVPFTDRSDWFSHYGVPPHHLLVAEVDGTVQGYATSSPYRPKPGYRTTVETSVYLAQTAVGQGIGTSLYAALLALVDTTDVHRCVAGIALPNPASVALHERFGFRQVGVFTEVGFKQRWIDVAWYERAAPLPLR